MRKFYSLSEEEKAFLIVMFNEVKFNKFKLTRPMDETLLCAMKETFVRGCLKAYLASKQDLDKDVVSLINDIISKVQPDEIFDGEYQEEESSSVPS